MSAEDVPAAGVELGQAILDHLAEVHTDLAELTSILRVGCEAVVAIAEAMQSRAEEADELARAVGAYKGQTLNTELSSAHETDPNLRTGG